MPLIVDACAIVDKMTKKEMRELQDYIKDKLKVNKDGTKKKPNGYNLYMKAMMATSEVKEMEAKDRMSFIGVSWKALSDEEKQEWKDSANDE